MVVCDWYVCVAHKAEIAPPPAVPMVLLLGAIGIYKRPRVARIRRRASVDARVLALLRLREGRCEEVDHRCVFANVGDAIGLRDELVWAGGNEAVDSRKSERGGEHWRSLGTSTLTAR